MAGYIEPSTPIVREALKRHAVGIARDALAPVLDAAVSGGLTPGEAVEVARQAIEDGRPGVLDRVSVALAEEIERRS